MIGTSRVIENDLFGIVPRLKSIDGSYFVVENYKLKRLELHSSAQRGNTLALVLPHRYLSAATVEYVRRTRAERAKELFAEMEKANARAESAGLDKIIKNSEKEVENVYRNL